MEQFGRQRGRDGLDGTQGARSADSVKPIQILECHRNQMSIGCKKRSNIARWHAS